MTFWSLPAPASSCPHPASLGNALSQVRTGLRVSCLPPSPLQSPPHCTPVWTTRPLCAHNPLQPPCTAGPGTSVPDVRSWASAQTCCLPWYSGWPGGPTPNLAGYRPDSSLPNMSPASVQPWRLSLDTSPCAGLRFLPECCLPCPHPASSGCQDPRSGSPPGHTPLPPQPQNLRAQHQHACGTTTTDRPWRSPRVSGELGNLPGRSRCGGEGVRGASVHRGS